MDQLLSMNFGAYVALGFVLYAIHEATHIKNRYIPLVAIVLGIAYAWFQSGEFSPHVLLVGIKYALYGVGTVGTIKFTLEKAENVNNRKDKKSKPK
ncbi:hypothetical protein JOD43_000817 [Pullulanibacillus pueri]|uniref:Holin n=1 Tax=Pullulanibacillus pueri TaxID=1437324 RepID=A0A8J3EMR3_9BACL|nr:phage holin family protein [Pullulanibacillus pueri]MBM7680655.1 hypothetical protein [Pullulanibacillus pueri]GGH83830.1 hypothetical protein GCM10007096_25500 [Pullulanibacillus pueri]